jgi:ATP phosphoribosyltransferase regulatory subunit
MNTAKASRRSAVGQPRGARDLMPAACAIRHRLVAQLQEVFTAWGYLPVAPPALEYYDVVARGLPAADRRRCVRFVDTDAGELVTLRADATPQVARMIGQRLGGELDADAVHRLCYATEVVRQPTSAHEPAEVHQVGVELVGDGHPAADAELLALAHAALCAVGLDDARLDVAHARLVEEGLLAAGLQGADADAVRGHIAAKDRRATESSVEAAGGSPAIAATLASLCEAFGGTSVVGASMPQLAVLGERAVACARRIEATLQQLAAAGGESDGPAITVDLGEVRGFDYYSGIRIRGWAHGVERPVLRGGRYDELMAHYDADLPASGFAIDLDALQSALAARGRLPASVASSPAHLVAVEDADDDDARARAGALAVRLRRRGGRVWVESGVPLSRAQALAAAGGAVQLTWVSARGVQGYRQDADGWRGEERV